MQNAPKKIPNLTQASKFDGNALRTLYKSSNSQKTQPQISEIERKQNTKNAQHQSPAPKPLFKHQMLRKGQLKYFK